MASTASINDSRPQAGPLPSKLGEIGYREDLHGQRMETVEEDSRTVATPLPDRHPADRDATEAPAGLYANIPLNPIAVVASQTETAESPRDTSSNSIIKKSIRQKIPTFGGVRITTLAFLIIQIIFIGGTIVGWVLAVKRINRNARQSSNNQNGAVVGSGSTIFIHVVFAVALIAQFLLFERRVFRIRAERYAYVHPREVLPTSRRPSNTGMGIAPWQRPPLPTYAAALAQSGHSTGDVEDRIIAVPPPPAYGQTRDSRLLLAGFLRNSLRAQRPVSQHSRMTQHDQRPLSYVSHDEQWQEIQDAETARKLEEALRMEAGGAIAMASTSATRR